MSNFNITHTALYTALLLTAPNWEVARPTEDRSAAVDGLVMDTVKAALATQVWNGHHQTTGKSTAWTVSKVMERLRDFICSLTSCLSVEHARRVGQ